MSVRAERSASTDAIEIKKSQKRDTEYYSMGDFVNEGIRRDMGCSD